MSNKITANCPHCNYEISINESEKKCFCQGCEKKLEIKNGMAVPFSDEMDKYKKSLKTWKITSLALVIIQLLCFIVLLCFDNLSALCLFVGIAFTLFGPIAIALTEPDGSNIKNSNLSKPKRAATWLKFAVFFLAIIAVAFLIYGMKSA